MKTGITGHLQGSLVTFFNSVQIVQLLLTSQRKKSLLNDNREEKNIEQVEKNCTNCTLFRKRSENGQKTQKTPPFMAEMFRKPCADFFSKLHTNCTDCTDDRPQPDFLGGEIVTTNTITKNCRSGVDFRLTLWYNEDAGDSESTCLFFLSDTGRGW